MLNKIMLLGNLTRDPELRYTANGSPVCNMGLAVNNRRNDNEVLFVDITCWGAQAESVATYMTKGRQVFVEGRLILRQWETQDGAKRSKHEVVADSVQFMDKPPSAKPDPDPSPFQTESVDDIVTIDSEDEIPF